MRWRWDAGPLGGDEAMRVELPEWDSNPYRRTPGSSLAPSAPRGHGGPGNRASSGTRPPGALTLDAQPLQLWETRELPGLGAFSWQPPRPGTGRDRLVPSLMQLERLNNDTAVTESEPSRTRACGFPNVTGGFARSSGGPAGRRAGHRPNFKRAPGPLADAA